MDVLNKPVVMLALAMFLAIGIERFLELARALFDHLEAKQGSAGLEKWTDEAETVRRRIEVRLNSAREGGAAALQLVLSLVCRYLGPPSAESGGLVAISVAEVRAMSIRLRYKFFAVALGIALAFAFGLDIFALVNDQLQSEAGHPITLPWWLGTIVTGV